MDFNWLNKTNVKILERLIGGKDYFNQIHEKTGIKSKNHLLKNLNLLEEKKILIKEKNRSNTFYEIIFNNLKDFNSKNEQIAHVLKSGYPLIGEEYFYHEFKKI